MKKLTMTAGAALLALGAGGAATAATFDTNATAFALAGEGKQLVTWSPSMSSAQTITYEGGADVSLDAISFRPMTRELYGYDDFTNTVYKIDTKTGMAMAVTDGPDMTNGANIGMDFNNAIDAARIVNSEDQNLVFFPGDGTDGNMARVEAKTNLFYKVGDPNEGENPNIVMNAYTNAVPMASSTFQYVIDSDLNQLASLNNNAGDLTTIGQFTLDGEAYDINEKGGFDILSNFDGDNTAYALLTGSDGMQGVFTFSLDTMMGPVALERVSLDISGYGELNGFAVANGVAEVPLPAAGLLLIGGLAGLGALRRRNKG